MNLWSALVAIVAIWGVVEVFRQWAKNRRAQGSDQDRLQADDRIEELKQRIATLERIVIDDKESLRRKFDDL